MKWFKALKAKHWDETWCSPENEPGSGVVFLGHFEPPPLRVAARWARRHLTDICTVVGTVAAVIALFR